MAESSSERNLALEESAFFLLESTEPFPVDLDDAIAWWDCRTKEGKPMRRDNIIVDLKADFIKDVDYIETFPEISGKVSGRPKGKKYLSIDCFKQFGMMISGTRGRDIRRHFLNCEAEVKRRLKEDEKQKQWKVIQACVLPGSVAIALQQKPGGSDSTGDC